MHITIKPLRFNLGKRKKSYIIFASDFDEKSGGVIALHLLCHMLNQSGERAYIWPMNRQMPSKKLLTNPRLLVNFLKLYFRQSSLITHPGFKTPLARYYHFFNSITVYPEIVSGNPLHSKNRVRWFLNKPGFFTDEINYGKNELYFFYNIHFNDPEINSDESNLLKPLYIMDDIYKKINFSARSGSCYILRKGKHKPIVHDLSDSILIDGLSHQEASKVFNNVKYCISYDTQTMLSKYAAMCGCISIVIPDPGISKLDWRPNMQDRYGIAYGFDDIDWCLATKDQVLEDFRQQRNMTNLQVEQFVRKTQAFFNN